VKDEQKRRSNVKKGLRREYKGWRENGGRHRYNVQPEHRKRERDRTELTLEGWEAGSNLSGGGSTHQQRSGKQSRTVYSLFCLFWTILSHFRTMTSRVGGVAREQVRQRTCTLYSNMSKRYIQARNWNITGPYI
jgi:hypothetical protein